MFSVGRVTRTLVLATCIGGSWPAFGQNLIQNPSFETNDGNLAGTTVAPPWSFTGAAVACVPGCLSGSSAVTGSWYAMPTNARDGNGTIRQSVNIATAGTYTFSFNWAFLSSVAPGPIVLPGSFGLIASVGGTQVFNNPAINSGSPYTLVTQTILLPGGASTVLFQGTYNSGYGILELDDVSLTFLAASTLAPLLPSGTPTNASKVAAGIDTNGNGVNTSGFNALWGLPPTQLTNALQQLAGEPGASGGVQAGYQLTNSLLGMLTTFGVDGSGPAGGGVQLSYAAEPKRSAEAERAYAALDRAAGIGKPQHGLWSVWASGYGGQATINGNAATGANDTRTVAWGTAAGASYRFSPETTLGFALAGGGTKWSIANGFGGGKGDAVQIAGYGRQQFGASYVSGALAYGWHRMNINRTVTVSGTDVLAADFSAQNLAGRIETGHRFGLAQFGITPFAAAQTQAFYLPGYSESATSGSNQFALSYSSRTTTDTRGELGLWLDTRCPVGSADMKLFSRFAWAHDRRSDATVTAAFQTLPGASFIVSGAVAPENVALVTGGAEFALTRNTMLSARFDGEFGSGYRSYAGTGALKVVFN